MLGLWFHWLSEQGEQQARHAVEHLTKAGIELIRNNPSLYVPITDRQGTDISLFLQLWLGSGLDAEEVTPWLVEMANRLDFAFRTRGHYPSSASDYRELAEHPRDRSDDYFEEATAGSTVIPIVASWLQALGQVDVVDMLSLLVREKLGHCTLQLWLPDETSETEIFIGRNNHGRALCDLPLAEGGQELLATIMEACRIDTTFKNLSPMKTGFWPIILLACRHHQLPVPPGFWIESLLPPT